MVVNRFLTASICVAVIGSPCVLAVDDSVDTQKEINRSAAQTQSRINDLDEQAKQDFREYRSALKRLESLEIYNRQMQRLVESQNKEMEKLESQIAEIDSIETGALPLMIEMTDTLPELVETDVPFLEEEREKRVANLRDLVDRADVTVGEKYRRILEAYQVELEYGRTIEAYRGEMVVDDQARTVEFLRIGRVGLYYQTLDENESGRWNAERGAWEKVDPRYMNAIREGLRIARDQAPPELLTLPINAPES